MDKAQFNVREGRVEIDVAHEKDKLTYIHPAFGSNNYENLRKQITEDGLKPFNMKDASLIVYSAFENPEQKYADEPKDIMRKSYFYVFNRNLWTPKGVYVADDNGKESLTLEQGKLEKQLATEENHISYSKDKKIRFVPKEHIELGEQTSLDLAKNKYVIALAGEEGAERLARVSEKYSRKPYVFGLENVSEPVQRVSGLGSLWDLDGRLGVDGGYSDGRNGRAFGVKK